MSKETKLTERSVDALLVAMGVDLNDGYSPKPITLPTHPEILSHYSLPEGLKRKLPPSLMDQEKAAEMWDAMQVQIDEKLEDFNACTTEYNTNLELVYKSSKRARGPGFAAERELQKVSSHTMENYTDLVQLQSEIYQLQRGQVGLLKGKRLVNEDEWWREYDELWEQKLAIQRGNLYGTHHEK